MSKARRDLDWGKQFELALYPEDAKAIRASRTPEDENTCTMCGDFCASRGAGKLFSGDLRGDKI
jgi:phosphomethylpyrimidine synthase